MEATAAGNDRPPVYFCHVCTARVSATRTSTQELECEQCHQTFVEELTESVVDSEALGGNIGHPSGPPSPSRQRRQSSSTAAAGVPGQDQRQSGGSGGGARGIPAGIEGTLLRGTGGFGGIMGGSDGGDGILRALGIGVMGAELPQTLRSGRRGGSGGAAAGGGARAGGEDGAGEMAFLFGNSGGTGGTGGGGGVGFSRSGPRRLGRTGSGPSSSTSLPSTTATTTTTTSAAAGPGNRNTRNGDGDGGGRSAQRPATAAAAATAAGTAAAEQTAADPQLTPAQEAEVNIAESVEQLLRHLIGGSVMPQTAPREGGGTGGGEGGEGGAGTNAGAAGQSDSPLLGTLLNAVAGGGSGHTEIFIGPNMQRVSPGPSRGGGDGIPAVMGGGGGLGSLGLLLRGFGMAGVGIGGGAGGNVGDYAFGDLSNLLQQLMAQDPNRHGPPPASKEVVKNLPKITITEGSSLKGQECAVCKDDFGVGEVVRELPCKHCFHEQCILPWLVERNTCPTCRHELPTEEESTASPSSAPGTGTEGDEPDNSTNNDDQRQNNVQSSSSSSSSPTSGDDAEGGRIRRTEVASADFGSGGNGSTAGRASSGAGEVGRPASPR